LRLPSRALLGAPVAAIAVAVGTRLDLPVLCPFRLCTGHACPGCGITRAVGALVRGDLAASIRFHPMAMALVIQLAVAFVVGLRRSESLGTVLRNRQWLVWLNATALLATWLIRWRFGLLGHALS